MFRFIDVLSLYKNLCNFVCFLVDVRFYFKVFILGWLYGVYFIYYEKNVKYLKLLQYGINWFVYEINFS